MKKVSVNIDGHNTSFSIEEEFLKALQDIAKKDETSIKHLISEIDAQRELDNLSSAIRVFILKRIKG